jgi:formate/nitrite transporter FocA (FNT family)
MRNWILVYLGNVVGCLGTVLLVVWSDVASLGDGAVGETAISIARSKASLTLI